MKHFFAFFLLLTAAVCFACPSVAAGVLGSEDLIDTLYSTDTQRYMKSHYIAADTMYTLTDVQIASILYEAIEGEKEAAAKIWNFITGNWDNEHEMVVTELLLGEFTNSDGAQKAKEAEINGLLELLNITNSYVSIDHPDISEDIEFLMDRLKNNQDVDDYLLDEIIRRIDLADNGLLGTLDLACKGSQLITSTFKTINSVSASYAELTNLFEAAAVLNMLSDDYAAVIKTLRTNAVSAGRDDLAQAIDTISGLTVKEDLWDFDKLSQYTGEAVECAAHFFFDVLVENFGARVVLRVTGSGMLLTYFNSAAFAYSAGTFVCDRVFDSSAVAGIYAQMEALADLEKTGAETLADFKDQLLNDPTYENAKLFHTAMRMQQQIEVNACELFIELCRIFDENGFKNLFGSVDYGEFIVEYEEMRDSIAEKKCCGILEDRAEEKCKENLTYSVSDNVVTITGCKNTDFATIRIPDTIDGYPVKKIGFQAFSRNSNLTGIELPDITSIGMNAFAYCTSLKNIQLPLTIESIGMNALSNTAITSINIPSAATTIPSHFVSECANLSEIICHDRIKEIHGYAFAQTAITDFTVPASVTKMIGGVFSNCTSLNSVIIEAEIANISNDVFEGCTSLTYVSLPDSITLIEEHAFYQCAALKNITLPESLVEIEVEAFMESGLSSVAIPQGVTTIGNKAFYGCESLKQLSLPQSLTSIGRYVFAGSGVEEVILSQGLSKLGYGIFMNCADLESIAFPQSMISISDYAFKNCISLGSAVLPPNLTSIGIEVFSGSGVQEVNLPEGMTALGRGMFMNCAFLKSISLPESLTSLGVSAFSGSGLEKIIIPEGITTLSTDIFMDCSELSEVYLPDTIKIIYDSAFENCDNLQSIHLPKSITSIGASAFINCVSLSEMIIPESIQEIKQYAFAGCTQLQSIVFPCGEYEILDYAFAECTSLKEIQLPQAAPFVGACIFDGCTGIEHVEFPAEMTEIPKSMFIRCKNLKSVTFYGNMTSIGEFAFRSEDTGETSVEYVFMHQPSEVISEYFAANYPSVYVISKEEPALSLRFSLESIEEEAFCASGFTTVSLPDTLETIGPRAFADCAELTQITIPASVHSIAPTAFEGCTDRLVIFTQEGSAAQSFAKEQDIICIENVQ